MNDRELLELAAKAAGYQPIKGGDGFDGLLLYGIQERWNPLNDDGDALRLAVKLNMDLMLTPNHGKWAMRLYAPYADQCGFPEVDPLAATRRAIVRAAAEIGKAM